MNDIDAVKNYEMNETLVQRGLFQLYELFSIQMLINWDDFINIANVSSHWSNRRNFEIILKRKSWKKGWPLLITLLGSLRENLLLPELLNPIQRVDHLTRVGRILWASHQTTDVGTISLYERRAKMLDFMVLVGHQWLSNDPRSIVYYHEAEFDALCSEGLALCQYFIPERLIHFVEKLLDEKDVSQLLSKISTSENHELLKIDLDEWTLRDCSTADVMSALSEWLKKQPILLGIQISD